MDSLGCGNGRATLGCGERQVVRLASHPLRRPV